MVKKFTQKIKKEIIMKRKTIWTIIEIVLAIVLVLFVLTRTQAQHFYSEVTPENYRKIISGNLYFPATLMLSDSSVHECYVARYPNTDRIRVKDIEDSTQTIVMARKYVKSFTYHIGDTNATHIYKDIDYRKRIEKIRAVEVIDTGRINVYVHRWVITPDIESIPYSKKLYHRVWAQFYLEKDGKIYPMNEFGQDIREFIDDNKYIYKLYKRNKTYREDGFAAYLSVIKLYNMYDRQPK